MLLLTAVFLLTVASCPVDGRHHASAEAKRALASSLIRNADSYKVESLREVLSNQDDVPAQKHSAPSSSAESNKNPTSFPDDAIRIQTNRPPSVPTTERTVPTPPPLRKPRTMSELFAWAIRMTTDYSHHAQAQTPDPNPQLAPPETFSESESLRASVRTLNEKASVHQRVKALHALEELCHSVDNGRDVAKSDSAVYGLVRSLNAEHVEIRSSAALAIATCTQNNPAVQNATTENNAVTTLAKLAAYDVDSVVRSRSLFALNSILELADARIEFEKEPAAIPAVHRALARPDSSARALRRALNLCELLAKKNLDTYKPKLEAWDIPNVIERLMRSHPDFDVRESAARVIAALDGRDVY